MKGCESRLFYLVESHDWQVFVSRWMEGEYQRWKEIVRVHMPASLSCCGHSGDSGQVWKHFVFETMKQENTFVSENTTMGGDHSLLGTRTFQEQYNSSGQLDASTTASNTNSELMGFRGI